MGPKCYAVQCIVNGKKNPKTAPSLCDFVTLPEEDRALAISNMHKNLVEIEQVVLEISSRTERHTDALITILCNRNSRGRSNNLCDSVAIPRQFCNAADISAEVEPTAAF